MFDICCLLLWMNWRLIYRGLNNILIFLLPPSISLHDSCLILKNLSKMWNSLEAFHICQYIWCTSRILCQKVTWSASCTFQGNVFFLYNQCVSNGSFFVTIIRGCMLLVFTSILVSLISNSLSNTILVV